MYFAYLSSSIIIWKENLTEPVGAATHVMYYIRL